MHSVIQTRRDHTPATLGIMICPKPGAALPFAGQRFFRQLTIDGLQLNMQVFVFSPDWIDWPRQSVRGYTYDPLVGEWRHGRFPLPQAVYDRAFYPSHAQMLRHRGLLQRLLQRPGVELLGLGLPGKLDVYAMLAGDRSIANLLPRTERYTGPRALSEWLRVHGEALLKPHGGSHGKGVVHIRCAGGNRYEAYGRDRKNRAIRRYFSTKRELLDWAHASLAAGRPFVIQQYLPLVTGADAPFDIRVLVQKNGRGLWRFTGAAARVGAAGGLTSNLHGGGAPCDAETLLRQEYGDARTIKLMQSIRDAALRVPRVLENAHGSLLELGIDFGIDRQGRIWLLEVNSKPGRMSFTRLHDKKARIAAITSPIRYARYVLDRQLGGQINEFDIKQSTFYPKYG